MAPFESRISNELGGYVLIVDRSVLFDVRRSTLDARRSTLEPPTLVLFVLFVDSWTFVVVVVVPLFHSIYFVLPLVPLLSFLRSWDRRCQFYEESLIEDVAGRAEPAADARATRSADVGIPPEIEGCPHTHTHWIKLCSFFICSSSDSDFLSASVLWRRRQISSSTFVEPSGQSVNGPRADQSPTAVCLAIKLPTQLAANLAIKAQSRCRLRVVRAADVIAQRIAAEIRHEEANN